MRSRTAIGAWSNIMTSCSVICQPNRLGTQSTTTSWSACTRPFSHRRKRQKWTNWSKDWSSQKKMILSGCSPHPSHKHCSKQAGETKWLIFPRHQSGATQWSTLHRSRYFLRCKMRPRRTWRPCILRMPCSRPTTLWRSRHPTKSVAILALMSNNVSASTSCLSYARFLKRPRLTRVFTASYCMSFCSMCRTMSRCTTHCSSSRIRITPWIPHKNVISLSCHYMCSTLKRSVCSPRGIVHTSGSTR